jgi:hypothetical protein
MTMEESIRHMVEERECKHHKWIISREAQKQGLSERKPAIVCHHGEGIPKMDVHFQKRKGQVVSSASKNGDVAKPLDLEDSYMEEQYSQTTRNRQDGGCRANAPKGVRKRYVSTCIGESMGHNANAKAN